MTISIFTDGVSYTMFSDMVVSKSIGELSGVFNFTTSSPNATMADGVFPFKVGQFVEVEVDGFTEISGYVDAISTSHSAKNHSIKIVGRDLTADIIDSTIGGGAEFGANLTLLSITKKILKGAGINMEVRDETGQPNVFKTVKAAKFGENVFEFLNKLAKSKQVLVTTDGLGALVYKSVVPKPYNEIGLFNVVGATDINNIKSASFTLNNAERFRHYNCYSSTNISTTKQSKDAQVKIEASTVSQGSFEDTNVRDGRTYNFVHTSAEDDTECAKRAKWEANLRKVDAFSYSCVVAGHSYAETLLYELNRLIILVDEYADFANELLIDSISWSYSLSSGSTTKLGLVLPDAYQVKIAEDEDGDKKVSKTPQIVQTFELKLEAQKAAAKRKSKEGGDE